MDEASDARIVSVWGMEPPPLKRNFAWTLAGNAVYALCQWGQIVVIAKLVSPEGVGQFALALALTAPVFMFTNLQLRAVQATDSKREYSFGDYLGLRLAMTAGACLLVVGLALVGGYRASTALVILAVGAAKAFESVSDVMYGLLQHMERMDQISISMMIKGPLSLLVLAIAVWATGSVAWGAAGLAASWGFVLTTYDVRAAARHLLPSSLPAGLRALPAPTWHRRTLFRLAALALPLGIVMSLISLNSGIPRYFLQAHGGEKEVGIFSAMAYLMVAMGLLVNALGQAAAPRLARLHAAGDLAQFRALLLRLVGFGAALGAACLGVAALAGTELLTWLYRPEYAERQDVFVVLMSSAAVSYAGAFLGYGMTAARAFRAQAPLFAAATVATATTCAVLVPSMGLMGSALGVLVSSILVFLGSWSIVARAMRH